MAIEVVDRDGAAAAAVPGALDQILDNYLDNAIAVAPPASTVEVVVDAASPSVTRVHVLDRGPGLSDEQLAHAFERFWRAADAGHDGSGIGLAIVAHLAATSGGTVALQRRPGGGLDASVTLHAEATAIDVSAGQPLARTAAVLQLSRSTSVGAATIDSRR